LRTSLLIKGRWRKIPISPSRGVPIGFGVLVPEDVEGVKERLCTPEQQITELRLAIWIEAYDLAIEDKAATL
jgi:hypothetical protein